MAKKQKDPIVLNHKGKEYTDAKLRENQEAYVAYRHIDNINRKIVNSAFLHDEILASKITYESRLTEALKEPEEVEVVAA